MHGNNLIDWYCRSPLHVKDHIYKYMEKLSQKCFGEFCQLALIEHSQFKTIVFCARKTLLFTFELQTQLCSAFLTVISLPFVHQKQNKRNKMSKQDPIVVESDSVSSIELSSNENENSDSSTNSNISQLSFEFTDENCQKRIDEFVQVTKTNSALAQFFLQDRKWNVIRSVNDYFREMRKKEKRNRRFIVLAKKDSSSDDADDEDEKVASPVISKKKSKICDSSNSGEQSITKTMNTGEEKILDDKKPCVEKQKLFRHITWNIDGVNNKNINVRTKAVCDTIIKEKATFIFLQEVTPESEKIINDMLKDKFEIFSGNDYSGIMYYTLTLVAKKPFIKILSNEIVNFKHTDMGRNIIKTNISIDEHKIILLNTHLESTKDGANARIQQLAFLLTHSKAIDPKCTVLVGGDLNLRDKELAGIGGLPPGIEDAWTSSGSRKEVEYTWDMMRNDNLPFYDPSSKSRFKPRMRFDRVFIRKTFPARIGIVHFGLIGLERLKPHVCFPSDHWGVITSYQIFHS